MFTCGPAFFAAQAGGGGGGGGHRYWRLKVNTTNNGGGSTNISELELRTSIGGATVTGSGTSSASVGTAGNALDNNEGSFWSVTSGNYPATWVYDFGVGNAPNIVEIAIKGSGPEMPRAFDLEWSDDNSTWTTLYVVTGETSWSTGVFRAFHASTDPDLYQYWRLYVTAVNGASFINMQTIAMRETSGGTDVALTNGTAIGNDNNFTSEPYRAFDGNTSTVWGTGSFPAWCGKDFGNSNTGWRKIIEWVLRADGTTSGPKTFKMQKSHDGSTWVDVITPADQTGWTAGEERTFS